MREPDGFREFVTARGPALLRTAELITSDPSTAEDLVQTSLVKSWRRFASIDNPDVYVRTVMLRTWFTWRRRLWRGEVPTADLPESGGHDRYASADARLIVHDVLATLSPGQRAVLALRYLDDLTEAQTAEVLGCSVGTVKSQTARALARLRTSGLLTEEDVR